MLLLADQLLVVDGVGRVDRLGAGHVLPVALHHDRQVTLHRPLRRLRDPLDELRDRRALLDHLHRGVVRRPVGVADEVGVLVAQVEELPEQRLVDGPATLEERDGDPAPHVGVPHEHPRGDRVGVVGRHRDQPVVVDRMRLQPVVRHAGQLLGRRLHRAHVVTDVAAELLVDHGDPLADLGQPSAGRVVLVDARAPELLEGLLQQPPLGRIEPGRVEPARVERREHVVEGAVLAQLGDELVDLDLGLLTGRPHLEVGVAVGVEPGDRADVAQLQRHLVPPAQHVLGIGRRLLTQPGHQRPCAGQPGLRTVADPRQGLVGGGQLQRGGWRHGPTLGGPARGLTPADPGAS